MKPWHALSVEETRAALVERSGSHSTNRLEDRETIHWPTLLARQFKSLLVFILAIAAFLSFFIGDKVDSIAILVIIILNALLGFAQEWKAETALRSLKQMLSPKCRIIRNGTEQDINAEDLVPGDHVLLSTGNAAPADIRIISATNLKMDESSLTGESVPVDKTTAALVEDTPVTDRHNMAWMGTHTVNGHGEGLVVTIGMETEFGRIAQLTGKIRGTQTPLQKNLAILARQLGAFALLVSLAVILIGLIRGRDLIDMAMTGITLAVAAIPEGLPAVVTITLALGVNTMARKKALLRHLQAAETLGAVSVICTDKTGTLTKNEMTVQKIWLPGSEIEIGGAGYAPEGLFSKNGQVIEPSLYPGLIELLDTGRKCNHAGTTKNEQGWKAIGSPTEAALIVAAEKAGLKQNHCACIIAEFSFNSDRKRMSVVEETEKCLVAHVKGAPESILSLCNAILVDGKEIELTPAIRAEAEKAYTDFAKNGLRTLALARKNIRKDTDITEENAENNLTFLGIVGVIDPPRPEVREALDKAKNAGIRVIVITGDSPDTALAVSKRIGLKECRAVTGSEVKNMADQELSALLKQDVLFARTVPEDKFRIVKLLQAQNMLVAMTGDGVNDAPALKQADIGIAMGIRGTDVARGAADIVLTDDNFSSIIDAVEEGRRQYTNIKKFVQFLIAHSIGEVAAVFFNILSGGPLILLPIQILWINLATDSVTALALSVEKAEKNTMEEPPRAINAPLLDKKSMIFMALSGGYIGFATLALFHLYLDQSYALASTIAFTNIVITAQVLVLNFRNLHGPVSSIGWFSNPWLLIAISSMILMQMAALYMPGLRNVLHTVPLHGKEWALIVVISLPLFVIPEIFKMTKRRITIPE